VSYATRARMGETIQVGAAMVRVLADHRRGGVSFVVDAPPEVEIRSPRQLGDELEAAGWEPRGPGLWERGGEVCGTGEALERTRCLTR